MSPVNHFENWNDEDAKTIGMAWLFMEVCNCAVQDASQALSLRLVDRDFNPLPERIYREDAIELVHAGSFLQSPECESVCSWIRSLTNGRARIHPHFFVQRARVLGDRKRQKNPANRKYTRPKKSKYNKSKYNESEIR